MSKFEYECEGDNCDGYGKEANEEEVKQEFFESFVSQVLPKEHPCFRLTCWK